MNENYITFVEPVALAERVAFVEPVLNLEPNAGLFSFSICNCLGVFI